MVRKEERQRTQLEEAAQRIILALNDDPTREGLLETPRRVADAFLEDFMPDKSPEEALAEMVMEDESVDQMLMVQDIPIRSHCEHHLIPWFGKVAIGYIPNTHVVGLSKLSRAVTAAEKGLTIQERVTDQIADAIQNALKPQGSIVIVRATHLCMLMRGVRTESQTFTTSAVRGIFLTNPQAKMEFLSLLNG